LLKRREGSVSDESSICLSFISQLVFL